MKPKAASFLDKAREFLSKAEDMLADDWTDEGVCALSYRRGFKATRITTCQPAVL